MEDLRSAIVNKAKLENDNFDLFKVNYQSFCRRIESEPSKPPQPVSVVELQAIQAMDAEWQILYNDESLQKHFNSPLQFGIHIVIRLPSHRKHTFDSFRLMIYIIRS